LWDILMEKQRTVVSLVLVAIGVGLLLYGLSSTAAVVSSGEQGQVAATSELAITQEVARGGVKRDESGGVKKTYEEGEKAPAACPT
jgi:hypothetical protein